jgi:hypothetical protein
MKRIYELELTEDFVLILDIDELLLSKLPNEEEIVPNKNPVTINIQRFEPQTPNNITEIARLFSSRTPGTWTGVIHEGFVYDDPSFSNLPTSPFPLSVIHLQSEQLQTAPKRDNYSNLINHSIMSGGANNYLYFGIIYALRENNTQLLKHYFYDIYLKSENKEKFFLSDLILFTIAKYGILSTDTHTFHDVLTEIYQTTAGSISIELLKKIGHYRQLLDTPSNNIDIFPDNEYDFLGESCVIEIILNNVGDKTEFFLILLKRIVDRLKVKISPSNVTHFLHETGDSLTFSFVVDNDLRFSRLFFGPTFRQELHGTLSRACFEHGVTKKILKKEITKNEEKFDES